MTDKELQEWEEEYKDVQKDIRWLLPLEIIIILIAILI